MTTRKPDELVSLFKQFAQSQRRQEVVIVLFLSAVIAIATAIYTWNTWKSVVAIREANEIQRQLLELQKASSLSKVALTPRRPNARPRIPETTEAHRAPSRELPSGQEQISGRQAVIDGQDSPAVRSNNLPSSHSWNTRSAMLDRPGRQ
jgi:hypothetical protein